MNQPFLPPFFRRAVFSVLAVFLAAGSLSFISARDTVALEWDANTEPDVLGYRLYFGTASGVYSEEYDLADSTSVTISGLTPGTTYFFAVTAYDAADFESVPSAEIAFTATTNPSNPVIGSMRRLADGSIRFSVTSPNGAPAAAGSIDIEASTDLRTWTLLRHIVNPSATLIVTDPDAGSVSRRFYRASAK